MKNLTFVLLVVIILSACNSGKNKSDVPYQSGVHKGTVTEVLQTKQYTYLLVDENDSEKWLALPKMTAKTGDVYFYNDGYEMVNFKSQELGRTFGSVIFLESVGTTADEILKGPVVTGDEPVKAQVRKYELEIPKAEGGIRIAELFENKTKYNNSKVIIKGKVVHYNPGIMDMNWIHLQDGTAYSGKFDLTATSDKITVNVGQVVTVEGTVVLDKDFGAGYFYEVMLSDIKILTE
jgi:hypothetical protein